MKSSFQYRFAFFYAMGLTVIFYLIIIVRIRHIIPSNDAIGIPRGHEHEHGHPSASQAQPVFIRSFPLEWRIPPTYALCIAV